MNKEQVQGCIIGGAIGDALGYPIEFMSYQEIIKAYGDSGITDLDVNERTGTALISDDTQMTLFTLKGLISARQNQSTDDIVHKNIYPAYMEWLDTQQGTFKSHKNETDVLLKQNELFNKRAPGNTCLRSLSDKEYAASNHSFGCGGVMRAAPVGLFYHDDLFAAYEIGKGSAKLTHGHVNGFCPAGALAVIIGEICNEKTIYAAAETSLRYLKNDPVKSVSTIEKIELALTEGQNAKKDPLSVIQSIGEGWYGDETLGIALYCAIYGKCFAKSVILAVNHDGDSDSTGAVCGNIVGTFYGINGIPKEMLDSVELGQFMLDYSVSWLEEKTTLFRKKTETQGCAIQ